MDLVNKEAKQKDGFGLPSTDIRKKDNALIEAARIKDKIAKWVAEFGLAVEDIVDLTKEAVKEIEAEVVEEVLIVEIEESIEDLVAIKKAELQAELDALGG